MKTTLSTSNEDRGGHGRGRGEFGRGRRGPRRHLDRSGWAVASGRELASMADALGSAGGKALERTIASDAIKQAAADARQVERQAYYFNQRLERLGRSEWMPGQPGEWSARMKDAMAHARTALILWRQKLMLTRDTDTGEYVIITADSDFLGKSAKQVSWEAMGDSITADGFGDSEHDSLAAWDWLKWHLEKCEAINQDETPAQAHARRLRTAAAVWEQWAGRDCRPCNAARRRKFCEKGLKATRLMLAGVPAEAACLQAGFKASQAGAGHKGVSAWLHFASSLRRMGGRVVSIRGRWAQPIEEADKAQILRELATVS
jgi:hypothetical protein